jgi:acetyl-CoA synthetase
MVEKSAAVDTSIDSILQEQRKFECAPEFAQRAHIRSPEEYEQLYKESVEQPEKFWARVARELYWFRVWDRVLEWKAPWAKWFVGGKINLSYNCVDRHVETWRKNKAAIVWESEPGEIRTLTYQQLLGEVQKFANVLKSLGVKKGDRVAIYMGMTPELAIAMLACARIGAPHTVVFGGFSSHALIDRIHDSQAVAVITQDGSYRRGSEVKLFPAVEEALKSCPSVKHVVVYQRTGSSINMQQGRGSVVARADGESRAMIVRLNRSMPSTRSIFSTPRGQRGSRRAWYTRRADILSAHTSPRSGFSICAKKTRFWCTADIGWVTGHSYVVYGPLQNGATTLMYEGAPNFPEPDRFWDIIDRHQVNVFYTAPTAIRTFVKWGDEWPK